MTGVKTFLAAREEWEALAAEVPSSAIESTSNEELRLQRLAAYGLLAKALKEQGRWREWPVVKKAPQGKPYLENYADMEMNMSHCKGYVAVVLSERGRVGIDVETRRKVTRRLIERVCSKEEQEAIAQAADGELEFLRYWTRKEAWLKCEGTGIEGDLHMVPQEEGYEMGSHPTPDGEGWLSVCLKL